jgi:hypothetical protein
MEGKDYEDAHTYRAWAGEERQSVTDYLTREQVVHGRIGDEPAWDAAPYVSVWAIESKTSPGRLGWWVISGDLPTDYVSATGISNPREGVRAICERWLVVAGYMKRGASHPSMQIGDGSNPEELSKLLLSRAETLRKWVENDAYWDYE